VGSIRWFKPPPLVVEPSKGFTAKENNKKCLNFEVPKMPKVVNRREFPRNFEKRIRQFAVKIFRLSAL
jgi:hypothetical protein